MRITPSIDDDVLAAAKELAVQQNKSIGEVISALTRQALKPTTARQQVRTGVLLPAVRADAAPVTPELVNQLSDELPS